MSETKPTPGPWAIDSELPANTRSVVARTAEGEAISANTEGPHDPNDDMANARLIAAAPELLEACKELVAALDEARAAITKAEATP